MKFEVVGPIRGEQVIAKGPGVRVRSYLRKGYGRGRWYEAHGIDDEIVAVRIAFQETELRERAKRLGAVWRPAQKPWEITWRDAKRLGIADRVEESHA